MSSQGDFDVGEATWRDAVERREEEKNNNRQTKSGVTHCDRGWLEKFRIT